MYFSQRPSPKHNISLAKNPNDSYQKRNRSFTISVKSQFRSCCESQTADRTNLTWVSQNTLNHTTSCTGSMYHRQLQQHAMKSSHLAHAVSLATPSRHVAKVCPNPVTPPTPFACEQYASVATQSTPPGCKLETQSVHHNLQLYQGSVDTSGITTRYIRTTSSACQQVLNDIYLLYAINPHW